MIPTFKVRLSTPKTLYKNDILAIGTHHDKYEIIHSFQEKGDSYQVLLTPYVRRKGWLGNFVHKIKFFFLDNYLSFIYDY